MVLLERAVCPAELAARAPHTPILRMLCVPRQTVGPNRRGVAYPAQADRTPPPADHTLAWRTLTPSCLGSWRSPGQPPDAQRFPVGLVLCYTWYCGTPADRRGVCGGATIAAATRRHGATVAMLGIQVSAREIWTANIAWELHRSHFRKDILAYIYCWLRPFASISLVRIGTSLVG
jgi:hypothetical protein